MKKFVQVIAIMLLSFSAWSQSMTEINNLIDLNKHDEARKLLKKAIKKKDKKVEAGLTLILLNSLEELPGNMEIMQNILPEMAEPSEYVFPLWFNDAITGGYLKKEKNRLAFMDEIGNDPRINGSIKGGNHYIKGYHYLKSNDYTAAKEEWAKAQSLYNWAYTGIFENTSNSGFYKDFEPLNNPKPDAKFKNFYNSDINWYTPEVLHEEIFVAPKYFINHDEGVIYAQTFVNSPEGGEAVLAIGTGGSFKAYLNDALVLQEEDEVSSELDVYKVKVRLNKGYNRILVQNCFTTKTAYPYFSVRILDDNWLPVEGLTSTSEYHDYQKSTLTEVPAPIPHFAEVFFKEKVKNDPENPLNSLLLSKVYYRNGKHNKAIKVIKKALEKRPENLLLHFELVLNYLKIQDRTELLKAYETLKQIDEDLKLVYVSDFEQELINENFAEAEKILEKIKSKEKKPSANALNYELRLASAKNENMKILALIEKAHQAYPDNPLFTEYKFNVLKNVSKNSDVPLKLLEDYLEDNYEHTIFTRLRMELEELGEKDRLEKLLKSHYENYRHDKKSVNTLSNYFYKMEEFGTALEYVNDGLKNMPFSADYWKDQAFVYESMGKTKEAMTAFEKAIHFAPNYFEGRVKLRELRGEKPLADMFEKEDVYDFLKKKADEPTTEGSEYNYRVLFHENNYWVYPEGAMNKFSYYAVKILNKAGIDHWKQANLSSGGGESVTIEKSELIKPGGQKIAAERNGGELVFTGLEVGDVVYIKYKTDIYLTGNFNEDFWTDYLFSGSVPSDEEVLRFYVPTEKEVFIKEVNLDKPVKKSTLGDHTGYEWIVKNIPAVKSENYMPAMLKVGKGVHISTIKSWDKIADWYYDKAMPLAKEDYNLDEIYKEIFSGKNFTDDFEKAKAIYHYIQENIRYSSVSFMQSGYVPQKPMVTISNKLGDCKDVSMLYHTLANKAGLNTNLVLVLTSDYGLENMVLPQSDFNHCIIKIDLDDKTLFQELTDSKLPFGATPSSIENAQGLVIPNSPNSSRVSELINIPNNDLMKNIYKRDTKIEIVDENLKVHSNLEIIGPSASDYRHHFTGVTKEEEKEKVTNIHNSPFKNNLQIVNSSISSLDKSEENFVNNVDFTVENDAAKIGGMYAMKLPLFTTIISPKDFMEEERIYPFRYYDYEIFEGYETSVEVVLPSGKKFVEVPENFEIKIKGFEYKIIVEKIGETAVKVTRKATIDRAMLDVAAFKKYQEVSKKIAEAEDVYFAYK